MQPIHDQYASSKNLESRMSIYQYAADPKTLHQWVAEQVEPAQGRVLELGCGTGELWKSLKPSLAGSDILLSDLSEGMLQKTREALGSEEFRYQVIDFHRIPFPDRTFDVVISNHNLYHSDQLDLAVSEMARVLNDGGVFYATTNSREHLAGLRELLDLEAGLWPNTALTDLFGAESGAEVLSRSFGQVERRFYRNELRITDFSAVVNYFLSVRDKRVHTFLENNLQKIRARFDKAVHETGFYRVTTKACLFLCRL